MTKKGLGLHLNLIPTGQLLNKFGATVASFRVQVELYLTLMEAYLLIHSYWVLLIHL